MGDLGGACQGNLDADGAGGSACPEDDDVLGRGVGELAEGLNETFAIGILAYPLAIATHDAVHGAHEGGGLAEAVEVLNHLYFVRDGTVKALEPHGLDAVHGVLEAVGGNFDGEVPPVEIVVPIGGFDHGLRWVFGYGLPEGGGQFLLEV